MRRTKALGREALGGKRRGKRGARSWLPNAHRVGRAAPNRPKPSDRVARTPMMAEPVPLCSLHALCGFDDANANFLESYEENEYTVNEHSGPPDAQ